MDLQKKYKQFLEQIKNKPVTAASIDNAIRATGYIPEMKPFYLAYAETYNIDIQGELATLANHLKIIEAPKSPHFERIGNAVITPITWAVKGLLESGALGMIFGDSGTCKSFIAVAFSACIATGEKFFGHRVKKGAVYYIATEGSAGIIRRFRAWAQENKADITNAPIYRYTGAVNLLYAADILIKVLENAIESEKEPPILAVIDTWSRSLAGDDSDTGAATEGLAKLDTIRAKFPGLAIIIIHHTGHHDKNRARGAYLIHAAVDSEFKVEKDESGNIIFTNTKSKESELLPPMVFKARRVQLLADEGRYLLDEDNEIETSVILEAVGCTQENPTSSGENSDMAQGKRNNRPKTGGRKNPSKPKSGAGQTNENDNGEEWAK